jgi:hypothetical protein
MEVVELISTYHEAKGGEQKRGGPGRPGGKVLWRARQARFWSAFGYFPEEIVGWVAPELAAPSDKPGRKLTSAQRRRRARKEMDRWERQLREYEQANGLTPWFPLKSRDEEARKEARKAAAERLDALEKANARVAVFRKRLARDRKALEEDSISLRAEAAQIRAEAEYGQAVDRARAGRHAAEWHGLDLDIRSRFRDGMHALADSFEQQAEALESSQVATPKGQNGAVTTRFASDLSPEERARYGL